MPRRDSLGSSLRGPRDAQSLAIGRRLGLACALGLACGEGSADPDLSPGALAEASSAAQQPEGAAEADADTREGASEPSSTPTSTPAQRRGDPWAAAGLAALRPELSFAWPVEQVHVTSHFGWRSDPVSGAGIRLHRGLDLRGERGDLVTAVAEGRVRFAGRDPALGNLVIIDHPGGVSSWYAHLSSIGVHAGLRVEAGSAVGAVGNTGRSAAPHLHLTMKVAVGDDEIAVDPLAWLG